MHKVFAQDSVNLSDLNPTPKLDTIGTLVSVLVKNAFMAAGVICFALLIFGGFQVIVAAGDPKKTQQGRDAIIGAVTGLLLIIGSFWIVQIIEVISGATLLPI